VQAAARLWLRHDTATIRYGSQRPLRSFVPRPYIRSAGPGDRAAPPSISRPGRFRPNRSDGPAAGSLHSFLTVGSWCSIGLGIGYNLAVRELDGSRSFS
jgi:hypothetical protein